ncbi:glycine/D-amino acid oxidase-like deaminating enzyme [Paenibacillus sp. BK033]|uniref:NAD(P)/FAD-dependent oxidoreductase n=1 Tax=Paenibacillus sp. BK033 TaxID=2512133 RepID=UPI0010501FD7|nr:FAD-dependent oxidoreductase [Paenibacillus sp. BK033]TCM96404.1 glycine/D-amino acid oxidase-like deaminating enzyme [Paenibacillus sp. BK033]
MNLQSGTYYWPTTLPDAPAYPSLQADTECDVAIIGGGSSAAQCAYYLAEQGLKTVVLEKGRIGGGSTSTNTAIIQYSGEKMFTSLAHTFGESYIADHIKLLKQAIDDIEAASLLVETDCEFRRRDTLYSASCPEDVDRLRSEYEFIKQHGAEVDFWLKDKIEAHYPFSREAAIYSYRDGELNPYKFTHALFQYAANRGVMVYEQSEMNGHHYDRGLQRMMISTKNGYNVQARYVIFAAGYDNMDIRKEKQASFVSTYTVTTQPVTDFSTWHNRTLLWETARPYIYIRTTADDRVIIGGLDENTMYPDDRDSKQEFHLRFPDIPVESAYSCAAFYGGMVDGLPIIGKYEEYPNSYFLLAYGDNGTVYSQLLSKIIIQEITEGYSPYMERYLQDRPLLTT